MDKRTANTLRRLMDAIIEEAESCPEFSEKLERILDGSITEEPKKQNPTMITGAKRAGNRRDPAVLDPIVMIENDEAGLLDKLQTLTDKELKDIIADYGMDPSKLAMKWKSRDRLIRLIVEASRRRASKGDAFREHADEG